MEYLTTTLQDFQDAQTRGQASNQRASRAKRASDVQTTASWAPSKGAKTAKVEDPEEDLDDNPFEMLFDGEEVRQEELEELAEALDFTSAVAMARLFASLDKRGQSDLLNRAKVIVERI